MFKFYIGFIVGFVFCSVVAYFFIETNYRPQYTEVVYSKQMRKDLNSVVRAIQKEYGKQ